MPFKSQAQRKFMYSQHPKIAARWEKETPKGKLPDKKEDSQMADEKKMDEKPGGFLSKLGLGGKSEPEAPAAAPGRKGVDPAKMRDPQGFITSVQGFINGIDRDIEMMKHFSDTYKGSASLDKNTRMDAMLISKELDKLKGAIEPPIAQLGNLLKHSERRLQQKNVAGPGSADVRSNQKKAQDKQQWGQTRAGLRMPFGR